MKLKDFLATVGAGHDVDLYHEDYDDETATMVDCSLNNFTAEGLEYFDGILNASVVCVRAMGENWVEVIVTGVAWKQVTELPAAHSGYCSLANYDRWFAMDAEDEEVENAEENRRDS